MTKAKTLIYDLEVSPTLGWTYGLWDTRVIRVERQPYIMSFSYRWYGTKKTHHLSLEGSPNLAFDDADFQLVEKLWELFDEADVVVAHNANRFDNKVATAAFLRHNLSPPSPYKTVDTLRVAKSVARFNSNSLDALGEVLGLGRKTKVTHSSLWYDCLQGDRKAWRQMRTYNNQDVDLLYDIYERLRPWIKNHANLGDLSGERGVCPKCGSPKLEKRGVKYSKQTYQCKDCHGWCNDSTKKGSGRIVNS